MIKLPKKTIRTLISEVTKDPKLPLWLSFLVHLICNIQVTHLILQPTLNLNYNIYLKVFKIVRIVSSYTVGLNIYSVTESQDTLNFIWFIMTVYVLLLCAMIAYTIIQLRLNRKVNPFISKVLKIIYFLHPKIFFCPIHYYMVWVASLYTSCTNFWTSDIQCNTAFLAGTIIIIILNFGISLNKEMFSCQVKKQNDPFAVKSNTFFRFLLLHKTVIIILIMVVKDSSQILSAVFNFIFPAVFCLNLLTSLPFYNIFFLKLSSFFAATFLSLSFNLMLISFGVPQKYMEIMMVIMSILVTRISFIIIDQSMVRILRLDFRNPQEAAHTLVLLKKYTSSYSDVSKLGEKYKEGSVHLYGLLTMYKVDPTTMKEGTLQEYEAQLYTVVINKLNELLKRYPKSELMVILIAQIYIKKLKNAARAIALLTQFESRGASMQAAAAIKNMYSKLERMYSKVHSDSELELLKYFTHRDQANKFKDLIQQETAKHLKIWREISSENINSKSVADDAEEVDRLNRQINRMWNQTVKNLDKNFISPMLMYGSYVDIIRKDGYTAKAVLQRYHDLRKAKSSLKKDNSPFSEEVAVILASIETENCGVVVDISSSVEEMFNITKDKLIGQKIDLLLPRVTAKKHDMMIKRYSKKTNQDLNSQFDTYAKTVDGHLFPIDMSLKIYPYINKGLNVIAHIKRLRKKELLLIIDQNGAIIDCSEDLFEVFKLSRKDLDTVKATDLCPDLREIENAIHYINGSGKDFESIYRDDTKSLQSEEKLDFVGFNSKSTYLRKFDSAATGTGKDQSNTNTNNNTAAKEMDETMVSQGLATYQDTRNLSQSQKSTLFKTVFTHNSPTLFSTIGPKRDSTQFGTAVKNSAEEVCKKFKKGAKLDFYPKSHSKELNANDKMEFKVVVVPYFLEGELYKLVKLKNLYLEENMQERKEASLPVLYETKLPTQSSDDDFAESFPDADEKNVKPLKLLQDSSAVEKKKNLKLHKNQVQLEKLHNILAYNGDADSGGNSNAKQESSQSMQQRIYAKGVVGKSGAPGDDTSSLNYSHKETRIVKALNELFDQATLRPITKVAVLIVYFVMVIVLALAGLNYFFSSKSYTDMENGVLIVNTASYRILNSVQGWQWNLVTYARSTQLRPISTTVVTAQQRTNTSSVSLLQRNAELQAKLQSSGDNDITRTFFNASISLWVPYTNKTFDGSTVDTFTATNVIITKNYIITKYPWQKVLDLNGSEDFLFTLNNTCNDVLVMAESQISTTESLISDIIKTNQTLVLTLLVFEMVSLFCVGLSLLLVVRVIMQSYKKLFRVLTRVSPDHIVHRLAELSGYNDCLSRNLEAKDFSAGIEAVSEMPTRKAKKDEKKGLGARYREDKFSMRQLTLFTMKSLVISLSLIAIISGVFLYSYFTSKTTFNSLKLNNERLSLAHRLGYTFDMTLGLFYYSVLFQNDTLFQFRHESPATEMDNTLDFLGSANEALLTVLADPDEGISDPVLEEFLTSNLCQFLDSSTQTNCILSTQGGQLGLLGLNTKYYKNNLNYVQVYRSNPTFAYASQLLVNYSSAITNDVTTIPAGYQWLRNYLINDFTTKVDSQKSQSLTMFIILLVCLLGSTCIIQLVTIMKFKTIDVGIRKILKVVPFHIIQENRLFGFYLKSEFARELENIKQFV